ncbi:MAG: HAD-IA family hydrolase [Rubricella sp.]
MSRLRLAVFDMDGTLIDSQSLILASMRAAFAELGRAAPSDADVLSIVGLSLPVAIARLAPGLSPAAVDRVADLYKAAFVRLRAETGGEATVPLYPGMRGLLEDLSRRESLLLGVATGKARRGLDHVYAAHGIGHHFVTSQTADTHPSKPHPAMLHAALSETGVDPADAVMIGDTEFDMEMGRAAGMRTIAVSWGYHPVERLRAADRIVNDADGLRAALAEFEAAA